MVHADFEAFQVYIEHQIGGRNVKFNLHHLLPWQRMGRLSPSELPSHLLSNQKPQKTATLKTLLYS